MPRSSQTFCQRASALSGLKRDAIAGKLPQLGRHPAIAARRRSRARVRMISSSRCTVAAVTGASTHWPFCSIWRAAATRSASARRSRSRMVTVTLTRSLGSCRIGVPVGDDHAAVRIGLGQRREGQGVERGAPQIGVDADRRRPGSRRGRLARPGLRAAGPSVRLMSSRTKSQAARARAPAAARPRVSSASHESCPWKRTGIERRYRYRRASGKRLCGAASDARAGALSWPVKVGCVKRCNMAE